MRLHPPHSTLVWVVREAILREVYNVHSLVRSAQQGIKRAVCLLKHSGAVLCSWQNAQMHAPIKMLDRKVRSVLHVRPHTVVDMNVAGVGLPLLLFQLGLDKL
jgi:hypothetical protein